MSGVSAGISRSSGAGGTGRTAVESVASATSGITVPVAAAVLGATSIVVGILWDISWHRSIGRDSFWTPAHMAIYLGGLLAGAAAGVLVLRATFGSGPDRDAAVSVGPLRGPLGAFVMIWGAVAMLASAPFDDWWHNAYGLDVKVLSPPHAVLAVGMIAVVTGALLLAISVRNRTGDSRGWDLVALYASGIVLTLVAVFVIEYTFPLHQHSALFYEIASFVFPFFLVRTARAALRPSEARSGATLSAATASALVYMGIVCVLDWVLPLFPAQPRLAPIYNPITRMVPFAFPLLLVFPALAIDTILGRFELPRRRASDAKRPGRNLLLAAALGAAFFLTFLAVQWPFALFQLTPAARNWFFVGDRYWSYSFHLDSTWRYGFDPSPKLLTPASALIALGLAVLSSWLGLAGGRRLSRVLR